MEFSQLLVKLRCDHPDIGVNPPHPRCNVQIFLYFKEDFLPPPRYSINLNYLISCIISGIRSKYNLHMACLFYIFKEGIREGIRPIVATLFKKMLKTYVQTLRVLYRERNRITKP